MAETRLAGRGYKTLAALTALRVETHGQRKSFAVCNLTASGAANSNLYICDDSGSPGTPALVAFPSLPIGMDTDEAFFIYNPNAGSISFVLGEVQFTGSGAVAGSAAQAAAPAGGGGGTAPHPQTPGGGGFGGRYYQP